MNTRKMNLLGIGAAVVLAFVVSACSAKTADSPPFRLTDEMQLSEVGSIEVGNSPTGYPGASGFVYGLGIAGRSGAIRYRDLETEEESEYITGLHPSLCDAGLYYYDHGTLKFIPAEGGEPERIGVSGYESVIASPGNRWLVLISSSAGTSEGKLAINDRESGSTIPLAWSEENDARRPSWADDERLLCDAVAPEGTGADRAIYELFVDEEGLLRSAVLKLAATEPADNGSGWLACLEPAESGSSRVLAVYDVNERTRLAWRPPGEQQTYGDIVWIAEDMLAVELETKDVGTSLVLLRLEGR